MLISLTMRSPLTNTEEMRKICSESVELTQSVTKSFQIWEMVESNGRKKPHRPLGEGVGGGVRTGSKTDIVNRKNYLRHRGRLTAKYLHIAPIVPLLRGGDRGGGSPFALQRAGDKNAAAGYLWSASVRSTDLFFCYQQKNNIRIQRSQALRVFRAAALKRFWVLLAGQKYHPAGRRRY